MNKVSMVSHSFNVSTLEVEVKESSYEFEASLVFL